MARAWDAKKFNSIYSEFVCPHFGGSGPADYCFRYRLRYKRLIKRFCELASPVRMDVLDVGGGQLALLCKKLWNDRACAADLGRRLFPYLESQGVETVEWNLCEPEQPLVARFDVIFFSEVIEHLPLPGHIVLERLRRALKPNGIIICSTPNFFRLHNLVYMALGIRFHDYFRMLEDKGYLGHVIEYSRDHLQWQFEKAGFKDCRIEYCQMHHSPINPVFRIMSWIGYPLFVIPHFRDNLLAIARAP
jgi:2-polyprenyl-3-methyl-5-hydroxy-6-metoxy-1,4-benzoquinol methylase